MNWYKMSQTISSEESQPTNLLMGVQSDNPFIGEGVAGREYFSKHGLSIEDFEAMRDLMESRMPNKKLGASIEIEYKGRRWLAFYGKNNGRSELAALQCLGNINS